SPWPAICTTALIAQCEEVAWSMGVYTLERTCWATKRVKYVGATPGVRDLASRSGMAKASVEVWQHVCLTSRIQARLGGRDAQAHTPMTTPTAVPISAD